MDGSRKLYIARTGSGTEAKKEEGKRGGRGEGTLH